MIAWILVFHLTGLVFWLGSLLVVTHVLAIHSEEPSTEARATLGRLEMKLLKFCPRASLPAGPLPDRTAMARLSDKRIASGCTNEL